MATLRRLRHRNGGPGFWTGLVRAHPTAAAWLILPLRVYLGYQWLTAGWQKLRSPGWMQTGQSLHGFWQRAVDAPVGGTRGILHYGWYHSFLTYMLTHDWSPWFAKLIAAGETAVGVLLILGAFTGGVAGVAALMNFNYMLAGSASANPVLFSLAILLVLLWRVAGYIGLDSVLLPSSRRFWHALSEHSGAPIHVLRRPSRGPWSRRRHVLAGTVKKP